MVDPLSTGHHLHAQDDVPEAATGNLTDLRRARQRARATVDRLQDDVMDWVEAQNVEMILRQPDGDRRINVAVAALASKRLRNDLVQWLDDRRRTTMARAIRAAFDRMQSELPGTVDISDLVGLRTFSNRDQRTAGLLRQVDVGLLSTTETEEMVGGPSVAMQVGNRITRQLRLGVSQDESVTGPPGEPSLRKRVEMVLTKSARDAGSIREEMGVQGQNIKSKAQMMAHDSVQDAYNTAAQKRYLENGFRYAVYDATCDFKTSALCIRLGECDGDPVVFDMMEMPWLIPPNHPHCRSGIRPVLEPPRDPITQDDIGDSYLQTIFQTAQFRPPVLDDQDFQPTALTRQLEQA